MNAGRRKTARAVAALPERRAALAASALAEREAAVMAREKAADRRETALREQVERSTHITTDLREANERLVVATINAQVMTEAAEAASAQMSYMAEHDFLTGLPNRALLMDRLAQAIMFAHRHHTRVALLYVDLDHFKHINDSLGHDVGDELLQSVSMRLQACVRLSDTVSRQGGDEFVVLLSDVEQRKAAELVAQNLIQAMAEPHLIRGHRLHVRLSIGISVYPDDARHAEALIKNADIAMYRAKKSGRNNYQSFTQDMNTRAVARQSVEEALCHAIEHDELVLHYQPKVNLETNTITGAEALLRWQRRDNWLVSPSQFVGIAEESGLIVPIGQWVLRKACRQAVAWLQAGLDFGQIAVNVSAVEFNGKDFLSGVQTVLDDTGLDPRHLELELTETGLMLDTELTATMLHALKALGVGIAVDDFGTGYSSLSYLLRFPIDTLKIDLSFVQAIHGVSDADQDVIVSAIIAMGTSLKQRVVAEGIETPEQLAFLQSQGCTEGQGFYFSRPVAAGEFAALLRSAANSSSVSGIPSR
jgi:diguanylate cyclase (GGDEF)-like protein